MKPFSLPGKVLLAPMAGVTDVSYRLQCKRFGAALCVTELTSVEGIVRKENELHDILDVLPTEQPSIQLFGSDVKNIIKAAQIVEPLASVIDFNIGCPAPHITAQDAGAALLQKPEHLHKIISSLVDAVKVPVTAKIRAGPNDRQLVYKNIARTIEDAGASMLAFHPRTVKQGYSGNADWSRIKEVKELIDIPVCGNGDIDSPEQAQAMLEETGCDYVMIGRGAMGNPFIFEQCNNLLAGKRFVLPSEEERRAAWLEYLETAVAQKVKFSRLKNQAMYFSKGFDRAKELRRQIGVARTVADLQHVL